MKHNFRTGLSFLIGVCVGSYITYTYIKDTYAEIAQEEIDSVKEAYAKKDKTHNENIKKTREMKQDIKEYTNKLKESGYINYSDISKEDEKSKEPFVIAPEDYGELDDYETLSLTYYSDGVLTDENDEIITKPEELVGKDFASHFGDYEDDSVFIRNNDRKIDFEILMDYGTYLKVRNSKTHLEV